MNRFIFTVFTAVAALAVAGCNSGTDTRPSGASTVDSVQTTARDGEARSTPTADVENGILFFGNSITAGHGVDSDEAFPAHVEDKIDSLGWNFQVVSAGVSGETSAGGLRRINWVMKEGVEVMLLELGGNDGLRGVPVETTKENLSAIIDSARAINPEVRILLAGMQVPPNLGSRYTEAFRNIYPELASDQQVELIPFLLEGVGGVPELNQSDGIHPTARGHRMIAETVWEHLKPILQELRRENAAAGASGSRGSS